MCAHVCVSLYAETDEQRDSAVSCGGLDGSYQHSEEALGIFSMPSPDIPTHPLDLCQYPVVQAKVHVARSHAHVNEKARQYTYGWRSKAIHMYEEARQYI